MEYKKSRKLLPSQYRKTRKKRLREYYKNLPEDEKIKKRNYAHSH